MDWSNVLISVVSVILTALAGWGVAKLTALIDNKITDATLKTALSGAINVVTSVVKEIYQTYVEALKDKNAFTAECQKQALASAIEKATALIPEATQTYISTYFGDFETWLTTQIESIIYSLKNNSTEVTE